jgi:hypothetical protein
MVNNSISLKKHEQQPFLSNNWTQKDYVIWRLLFKHFLGTCTEMWLGWWDPMPPFLDNGISMGNIDINQQAHLNMYEMFYFKKP